MRRTPAVAAKASALDDDVLRMLCRGPASGRPHEQRAAPRAQPVPSRRQASESCPALLSACCEPSALPLPHSKRRTVQKQLVEALSRLLAPGARVFLQSDVLEVGLYLAFQMLCTCCSLSWRGPWDEQCMP